MSSVSLCHRQTEEMLWHRISCVLGFGARSFAPQLRSNESVYDMEQASKQALMRARRLASVLILTIIDVRLVSLLFVVEVPGTI